MEKAHSDEHEHLQTQEEFSLEDLDIQKTIGTGDHLEQGFIYVESIF